MAFNLEKLEEIAKPRSEAARERVKVRRENRDWLRLSQEIALAIHHYLKNSGISQKQLAEAMGVSPVYVVKLLKGGENLTLETICKIQKAIGENLITVATPYITRMIVELTSPARMGASAVSSEKFKASANNQYVRIDDQAA